MPLTPLLIQTGTPPQVIQRDHGDLPDWFAAALDLPRDALTVIRAFEGERPPPATKRPVILTGSWAMVTDRAPWSEALADWIRAAMVAETPLFGVCYGHQLMAYALGGTVGFHPDGREIGSQRVTLTDTGAGDPMLVGAGPSFVAQLTHTQTVLTPPPGATVLARSDRDPHQILRYGPNAISTQFHPEFTPAIMSGIIRARAEALESEGRNPATLLAAVTEAFFPTQLLHTFIAQHHQEA